MKVVMLLLLLARAVYTDVKTGKIENRLTAPGWVLGLLYTGYFGGREQVLLSLKMTGIVMAALFFLYVMKGLGGGDIKLFGMLAAFYPEEIFGIVVLSFFLGAGFALFRMVVRVLRREAVYQRGETLHFSIPIAMAAMVLPVLP